MMIIHQMILILFSLLNEGLEATWSFDRATVDLTTEKDEDTGRDGEDRQNYHNEAITAKEHYQTPGNKKYGQQDHAYALGQG